MEIAQDCFIFDYKDITDIIFGLLDFATISAIAPVCKRFAALSKEHYTTRLNQDVIDPARQAYDAFYQNTMRLYLSNQYYGFMFRMRLDRFLQILDEFEAFVQPFIESKYWVLFLYDLDAMESMFLFLSRLNHVIEFNKQHIFFNTRLRNEEYKERGEMYRRLQAIFDELDNYMYVEYPDRYVNSDLHTMARFKKIEKHWGMKKSKLKRVLQRPEQEVYYLQ